MAPPGPRDQSPRAHDRPRTTDRRDNRDSRDNRDNRSRRDRSLSREHDSHRNRRDDYHSRRRSRSRSPFRTPRDNTRQRSPPRRDTRALPRGGGNPRNARPNRDEAPRKPAQIAPPPEDEDEEAAMKRIMGFSGFKSTKNTKVPGNDKLYAVRKDKQTQYRQYMNRVGGFNRPLSPSRM